MSNSEVIVKALFGPPLSGKGYVAQKIQHKVSDIKVITMSEVLRRSDQFSDIEKKINSGQLVDDRIVVSLLKEELSNLIYNGNRKFLLDGFPRTEEQVKHFCELPFQQIGLISIELSPEIILSRLEKRQKDLGRKDDNKDVLEIRINDFNRRRHDILKIANNDERCRVACFLVQTDEDSEKIIKRIETFMKV